MDAKVCICCVLVLYRKLEQSGLSKQSEQLLITDGEVMYTAGFPKMRKTPTHGIETCISDVYLSFCENYKTYETNR